MRKAGAVLVLLASILSGCSLSLPFRTDPPPAPKPRHSQPGLIIATLKPTLPAIAEQSALISAVSFADPNHGWMVVGDRPLMMTADGGQSWSTVYHFDSPVHKLTFLTTEQGWASTERDLLVTRDGGKTWTQSDPSDSTRLWQLARTPTPPCTEKLGVQSFVSSEIGFVMCGSQPTREGLTQRLYQTTDGGGHWTQVTTLPMRGYVGDLFFVDEQHGWFGGASYVGLWATNDGGRTWKQTGSLQGQDTKGIRFFTQTRGIVTGGNGDTLLATDDGGASWRLLYPSLRPQNVMPQQVFHLKTALAAGSLADPGAILKTTDGGRTWQQISALSGDHVELSFLDEQQGWALTNVHRPGGWSQSLYRTIDGGRTWTPLSLPTTDRPFSYVALLDPAQGYVGSGQPHWVTTDGGQSWKPFSYADPTGSLYKWADKDHGWKVLNAALFATVDAGQWWDQVPMPKAYRVIDYDFRAGGFGWVTASRCEGANCQGVLLMTDDDGYSWTEVDFGSALDPLYVRLAGPSRGFISDSANRLYVTDDGGKTWTYIR